MIDVDVRIVYDIYHYLFRFSVFGPNPSSWMAIYSSGDPPHLSETTTQELFFTF